MGKPTGFLELDRAERAYRPIDERLGHYKEFVAVSYTHLTLPTIYSV